ncbi:DUF6089 family protein [Flammeovirgaceae bacterium SG7u.111]|nr:DUF6089 family protein [Flammeovirgaceae bacterium SG7u.132]WPO35553.1 DUF6089 family protein [Flammeovirgaceae bacterium SG7u.111]
MKLHKLLGVFVLLLIVNLAHGQSVIQRFEIGAGFGGMNYKGDVAPVVKIQNTRPAGNFHIRFNFVPSLSWRTGVTVGQIAGADNLSSDPFYKERDFSFSSFIVEGNTILEYHFFDYRRDSRIDKFSPYIFAGFSLSSITSSPDEGVPYTGGNIVTPGIPFGVGIKKALSSRISMNWEFTTTKTFSDDVDGISDNPNLPKFQRSPRSDNDTYYYLGVSFSYRFSNLICPPHYNNSLYN